MRLLACLAITACACTGAAPRPPPAPSTPVEPVRTEALAPPIRVGVAQSVGRGPLAGITWVVVFLGERRRNRPPSLTE